MTQQLSRTRYRLIILFSIFVIFFSGCQKDPKSKIIERVFPSESTQLSAYGWIGVSFSDLVDKNTVQNAFTISPEIQGEIFWQGERIWFRPLQAFEPDTEYQARLSGEITAVDGDTFNVDRTWTFTIRDPLLLYYVLDDQGGEIWRSNADGSETAQLTFSENSIFEFASPRSGDAIVFNQQNTLGGRDLWLMDRNGDDQRLLLSCSQDLCSEPAWSMDEKIIAYTREIYLGEQGGFQPGQIWTVDVESGETSQLYQSESAFGNSPSFSPDGTKFAFYDTVNKGIRILDLTSSEESIIPTAVPGSGDWSPDGSKIIFTDLAASENEPHVAVYTLNLETRAVVRVLDIGGVDTDFSQPRWSPEGEWVAVSLRPVNSNISKTLWVLRLDDSVSRQVSDDQSGTFTAYQWDPWGDRLVFQRYDLSSGSSSIWVWASGESIQIIDNGSRPQWLP